MMMMSRCYIVRRALILIGIALVLILAVSFNDDKTDAVLIHYNWSCRELIAGNPAALNTARVYMNTMYQEQPDKILTRSIRNCKLFINSRGYLKYPIKREETQFPLAFTILVHENIQQMERLLRIIYRPHNTYCIHLDLKAPPSQKELVNAIASCFDNVFLASKREFVVYRGISRLNAEINCMKNLLAKNITWKYLINLPSTEFPLKTNLELVRILKAFNGANDIEGTVTTDLFPGITDRHKFSHIAFLGIFFKTPFLKKPPPHHITMFKGSAYNVYSRAFLQFTFDDHRAQNFLTWLEDTDSPGEFFWATLNHDRIFGSPGGYTGIPHKKPRLAAYTSWDGDKNPCNGKYVHDICVFGIADLTNLIIRKELFINKIQ